MRAPFLAFLLTTFPRIYANTPRVFTALPPVEYPVCRRNFTCAAPWKQEFGTIMADLRKEEVEAVDRLAEPSSKEQEILGGNEVRDEALKKAEEAKKEEELPKLSAMEFRIYNSMADNMEYFHNHFRQSWIMLKTACDNNRRPNNMSLKAFLSTGLQLIHHLEGHHSIEEAHVFPVLARKMPEFKAGRNAAELLRQHKEIHKGMEILEEYLESVRSGEKALELSVMKEKMEVNGWGDVLWKHLDQEVKTLGAENMKKYWSLEEMKRMPM